MTYSPEFLHGVVAGGFLATSIIVTLWAFYAWGKRSK